MGSYPPVSPRGEGEPVGPGDRLDPQTAYPEILPPVHEPHRDFGGQGFVPPAPRRRRRWPIAPATYTLVGINCAVFLLMLLAHGFQRIPLYDIALAAALLSFGGGLVFVRFLERWL